MTNRLAILCLVFALPTVMVAQDANITAMEYYIDVDPGVGNGTAIPFAPGTPLDVDFNIATAALSPGMHTLVIRAEDQNGDWSVQESRAFFVSVSSAVAVANITAVEYFLDTDPGFGNGVAVSVSASASQDIIENIPTGALSAGFHVLHVRAQDSDGAWSLRESRPFFVSIPELTTNANVAEIEYFVDTDPGFGNGTSISVTASPVLDITENIPTGSFAPGFHVLHARALDDDGSWGVRASRPFFVTAASVTVNANVVALEYFVDADPGPGNGTAIPVTTGNTIDIIENIPTGALAPGFHVFHVRAQDSDGTWGVRDSRAFFVSQAGVTAQASIIDIEYFFDTDPGYGNGTSISITSGSDIDIAALVPTSALSPGFHTLHIRAQDSDGLWGATESKPFFLDGQSQINRLEYYFDTDPGVGSATSIPVATAPDIDVNVTLPTSTLMEGPHTLGVRVGRIDDSWSDVFTADFTICTMPTAAFNTNIVCVGSATNFVDVSTDATGATYSWDFDSDGSIDDTTPGNTTFTYPAAGTYTAMLILNRSGCIDTVTGSVTVENIPVASAGTDQAVCSDVVTLGATLNAGETGAWTVITGAGTITDPDDPLSTFTNITSLVNTLQWTVTNTAGGCSASDQVSITSNQPIVAAPVPITASLGETTNANVQSAATVNPGDVLTTAIVTQGSKGVASLGDNGTINYTPNPGTVGSDVVVFEICNQCLRCATNNLQVTIQNNAPVISPAPITVAPGENVSLNLLNIITDPNNNLDLSSLTITQQPISGAVATIDAEHNLIIDYTGVVFSGTDQLTIRVCDLAGVCSTNIIYLEVNLTGDPPVTVFNALSPNGDGKHDFLEIENITAYPGNHIYIVNRWGDKIFEADGYNNSTVRFDGTANSGTELPAGTYFYSIDLGKGGKRVTGFVVVKR